MSIGSWDPSADTQKVDTDPSTLQRLIAFSRDDKLADLDALITGAESQTLSTLMKIDHAQWLATAEDLDDDDVLHLLRFFAVAENLPGWEAGADSPVIPLARTLRKRGKRLSKDLLLWLREVNDNRFLPYGPL